MALLVNLEIGDKIKETHIINSITEKEKDMALMKFQNMKDTGCLEGNFEDDHWYVNNEMIRRGLHFDFNQYQVRKQSELSYEEFVELVKYYMCLRFGQDTLHVLPRIVVNLKNAVEQTDCFTRQPEDLEILEKDGVLDFASLLPWNTVQFQISKGEEFLNRKRTLAEYQSYFMFNDIINQFWEQATEKEKKYFYPLYLWWNITMIIPLRVTEFILTPKECLAKKYNKYYITIRRTKLKGHTEISERYRIETDYKKYTYEISDEIANELRKYIEIASEYEESPIDSVFSCEMYKRSKEILTGRAFPVKDTTKFHFTYEMMNTMLSDFYNYYIVGQKNLTVRKKDSLIDVDENGVQCELSPNEIVYINLGDTRHVALQNLLINGCNLLMAKEISGHDTIDMIYHYSGNLKNLVKCHAYRLHNELKSKDYSYSVDEFSNADCLLAEYSKSYVTTDSGKCFSSKMILDNPEDCYKVGGECELCIYHEGKTDIEKYEKEFSDKIARIKIWITSKNELKDSEEAIIMAEDMAHATANLVIAYCKERKQKE